MELKKTIGWGLVIAGLMVGTSFITVRMANADGVPGLVPVQGCATDSSGNPIDGSQQVEFRLYSSATASQGDALHMEARTVSFRGCVFSEMLHPTELSIFENNPTLYMGIKIGSDAELTPRFEVGAAPYAVQARHADRATSADNGVPPGTIVAYGGTTPPQGWLMCDGRVVTGSAYPALATAIGVAWGNGGGEVGKFNLPDLRGRFLRGVDGMAGRDAEAAGRLASTQGGNTGNLVGSVQSPATHLPTVPFVAEQAGGHSHTISMLLDANHAQLGGGISAINSGSPSSWDSSQFSASTEGAHAHAISGGDAETRPNNAYINYIIKH